MQDSTSPQFFRGNGPVRLSILGLTMSLLAFLRNSMSSFQEPSMLKVQIMRLFANSDTLTDSEFRDAASDSNPQPVSGHAEGVSTRGF